MISIFHDLQLIKVSVVSNYDLLNIKGCLPRFYFGRKENKFLGYSHESSETVISSNTPLCLILDLSTSSSTMGVGEIL